MVFFLAVFINSVLLKEDITRGHFAYILMETVLHVFFSLWHFLKSKTRMVTKFVHNHLLFILDRCNISEYGVKKGDVMGSSSSWRLLLVNIFAKKNMNFFREGQYVIFFLN